MMSGRPALSSEASSPRLLVLDGGRDRIDLFDLFDVFDVLGVLGVSSTIIRVRSAFLFEVGEELSVRIEQDGSVADAIARVRAHLGPDDAPVTELEISERSEPREVASE